MGKTLILLAVAGVALSCGAASAAAIYVSPLGSDKDPGTKAKPFATLERARDEVRKLRSAGHRSEPITITVSGGDYHLKESLQLGPEESGSSEAPVIWQAARDEEVRLSGGVVLPAGSFHPITDEKIMARLDSGARDHVAQIDLKPLGVTTFGEYPPVFRGAIAVPELLFNDQRMTVARWPNEGWGTIAKIIEPGSTPRSGDTSDRPGIFEYSGDRPDRWDVDAGVWLHGYWSYDWFDQTIQIKSVDREKKQITMAKPAHYGIIQGNPSPRRYRALNLLEELDQPGEYYIDRPAGRLYFWPPGSMEGARIVLTTLTSPILVLKDADYIVVRGFVVESCLSNGIEVYGGRGDKIESCTLRNVSQLGIRVDGGGEHRVEACDVYDTGTGGVYLEGGDRKTLTPAGHQAANNHIWRFSQIQLTGAYAITLSGVGNRAAHNLIHDAPHQAILINGNDHIFEHNIVHDVCTETDDCGAIYKGRNPSCRGNIIRYNYWREIGKPMGHGSAAVYFDDGDGGDTVYGNVFYRCGDPGRGRFGTVFSHGGYDNRAENNIFIECKRPFGSAPWSYERWKDALNGGQDCFFPDKLLKEVDITKPPYTTRYPELIGFMDPGPETPRNNHSKNNVFVNCGDVNIGNWLCDGSGNWSTDQDPGFVDTAKGNYQLRPDSEVFKRLPGFQPIPFDKIGLETRRVRTAAGSLPKAEGRTAGLR
jgi:hypothetical protein